MPAIPRTIKTVKAAVTWLLDQNEYKKPAVTLLKEIYQGSNPLFNAETSASGSFADVSEGVCQGMAVEWIKANSVAKGIDGFRNSIDSDWTPFAVKQREIANNKGILRGKLSKLEADGEQFTKLYQETKSENERRKDPGFMYSWLGFGTPPVSQFAINARLQVLDKKDAEIDQQKLALEQEVEQLYQEMVFDPGLGSNKFKCVEKGFPLAEVGVKVQGDQGRHPSYYLINLKGDSGHSVAIHAAYRPRFLDANSCEFQFASMNTMYDFLTDYWEIYRRAGYGNGTSTLYRYQIRAVPSDLVLQYTVRSNMGAVLSQIK
jgi:hypothetical protein